MIEVSWIGTQIKLANFASALGGGLVGGTIGTAATLGTKGIKPKIIGAAAGTLVGAGVGNTGSPKVPTYQPELG